MWIDFLYLAPAFWKFWANTFFTTHSFPFMRFEQFMQLCGFLVSSFILFQLVICRIDYSICSRQYGHWRGRPIPRCYRVWLPRTQGLDLFKLRLRSRGSTSYTSYRSRKDKESCEEET